MVWLFSSSPLSKYRVFGLFYVLLRLNAGCYAVKYEEQISLHNAKFHCIMTTLNSFFKIEFERGGGTGKKPMVSIIKKNVQ